MIKHILSRVKSVWQLSWFGLVLQGLLLQGLLLQGLLSQGLLAEELSDVAAVVQPALPVSIDPAYPTTLLLGGSAITREFIQDVTIKVDHAFAQLGIEVAWVDMPARRSLQMAASGRVDGVYIRREKPDEVYTNLLKVDVPILVVTGWVWVRNEAACPLARSDLSRLATVDVVGFGFLDQVPEVQHLHRDKVSDIRAAFKVLQSGRIDYFTASVRAARYYERELDATFKRCFREPIYTLNNYTFLHRKHAALIPDLERVYRDVFGYQIGSDGV